MGNLIIHVNRVWDHPKGLTIKSFKAYPRIEEHNLDRNGKANPRFHITLNAEIILKGKYQYPVEAPEEDISHRIRGIFRSSLHRMSEANSRATHTNDPLKLLDSDVDTNITYNPTDEWDNPDPHVVISIRSRAMIVGHSTFYKSVLAKHLNKALRGSVEHVVERMESFDYSIAYAEAVFRRKYRQDAAQTQEDSDLRRTIRSKIRPYEAS